MAPVARELSSHWGVLEPLQSAQSVDAQIRELRIVLEQEAILPVRLIGSSWGAMLGYLYTARYPESVRKLILVGSGAFIEDSKVDITEARLARLDETHRREVHTLFNKLNDPDTRDKDLVFARLGKLFTVTDAYDPQTLETDEIECQYKTFSSVWKEALQMRIRGEFLDLGKTITCPVVAIHGDHDPHPYTGVRDPLSKILHQFRFILMAQCGHLPWIERHAKEAFFSILHDELK